jgi:hypothetical protein
MIDSWNPNLSELLSIKSHSIESKALLKSRKGIAPSMFKCSE